MRVLLYDPEAGTVERGADALLERWRSSPDSIVWLDFDDVTHADRESLLEGELGLHPLALQDALRDRHPPKVELFDQVLFVMLRELDADTSDIHFGYIGVSIFVGSNFLVSRSTGPSVTVDEVWNELEAGSHALESPGALALRLTDRIVRRYLPILIGLEPRLDEIESAIFDQPDDALLAELTRIKSRLKELRRIAVYHAQVLHEVNRMSKLELTKIYEHELTDVADQVQRTASLSELHYGLASDLADAYLGLSAHRLNQVMKVLTVITVIFVPLSFLAGVYGMNFENMPELHSRFGYYALLGVMACVVAVQLYLFRRKRWL